MQAVIVVPEIVVEAGEERTRELLFQRICGVPLLIRTALTAARSGASEILLVVPVNLTDKLIQDCTREALRYGVHIHVARVNDFDPQSWTRLNLRVHDVFLWVPWNWVTDKRSLAASQLVSMHDADFTMPAFITANAVLPDTNNSAFCENITKGVAVTSPQSVAAAERFLIARSGKVLDGIHTSFNRRLCRPFVRLLSYTSITPNQVTFMGVVVSVLAAVAFAQGTYIQSALGAFIFFVAGLFDEMDGMLARIKFMESPRGTWLEGFADGLSYLLLFAGITMGLRRQYGKVEIVIGLLLLVGTMLALIVTSLGRRRATAPDRPNEYLGRFYSLLENDSANWVSRVVRKIQAFQKRGVMIHYIVLFTVFGGLQLLFLLATIGAHLTWILGLYFNHRFFAAKANAHAVTEAL
jgi:phosphatidylglycerophosphate synthase